MYVHIYNKEKVNLYINPRNFFQVRKWGFIVQVRFILFSERFPYCGFIRDELHVRIYRWIVGSSLQSKYRFKNNESFLFSFNQFFNYDMKIVFTLQNWMKYPIEIATQLDNIKGQTKVKVCNWYVTSPYFCLLSWYKVTLMTPFKFDEGFRTKKQSFAYVCMLGRKQKKDYIYYWQILLPICKMNIINLL